MSLFALAAVLLLSPPKPEPPPVQAMVEMLGAKATKTRFDQWKSRWKINYFSKVTLCRPKGHPDAHHGYYEGDCRASSAERQLGLLIDTIDRSPENLRALFDQHKGLLFAALPPAAYTSSGAGQTVRGLLKAFEHVARTPQQRARLVQVRESVRALIRDPNQKTPAYGWLWAEKYEEAYPQFNAPGGVNEPWLLSFWARRLAEGNIDVVAAILGEIDAHYTSKVP